MSRSEWTDQQGVTHDAECFACKPGGCCCDLDCAAVTLAQEAYGHSTRRAMLGREWDDLTRDEQSGWLARARVKLSAKP